MKINTEYLIDWYLHNYLIYMKKKKTMHGLRFHHGALSCHQMHVWLIPTYCKYYVINLLVRQFMSIDTKCERIFEFRNSYISWTWEKHIVKMFMNKAIWLIWKKSHFMNLNNTCGNLNVFEWLFGFSKYWRIFHIYLFSV